MLPALAALMADQQDYFERLYGRNTLATKVRFLPQSTPNAGYTRTTKVSYEENYVAIE